MPFDVWDSGETQYTHKHKPRAALPDCNVNEMAIASSAMSKTGPISQVIKQMPTIPPQCVLCGPPVMSLSHKKHVDQSAYVLCEGGADA